MMELILEHSDVKVVVHTTRAANVEGDAATASGTTDANADGDAATASGTTDANADGDAPTASGTTDPDAADTSGERAAAQSPSAEARVPCDDAVEDLVEVGGLGGPGTTFVPREWLDGAGTTDPERDLACDTDTGALLTGDVPASLARGQDAARRAHRARERAKDQARAEEDAQPHGAGHHAREHVSAGTNPPEHSRESTRADLSSEDVVDFSESYRVPDPMARLVRLRDGACRFPGCAVTAHQCDLDHVKPWPAGPTTPTNLMALCRRHHRIKQRDGWTAQLHPDATVTWTDPTGLRTTTWPVDHLHLITAGATRRDHARTGTGNFTNAEIPTPFEEALIELLGGPANAMPRDYPTSFDIEGNTYGGPPPRIDWDRTLEYGTRPWDEILIDFPPRPPGAPEAIPF